MGWPTSEGYSILINYTDFNYLYGGKSWLPRFQVRVVTLAELASHKRSMTISELRDLYDREERTSRNRGLPPPVDTKSVEAMPKTYDEDYKDSSDSADPVIGDRSVVPKDLGILSS